MRNITITTHSGIQLAGFLQELSPTSPANAVFSGAAVVFSHGFLSEHTEDGVFSALQDPLERLGLSYLLFDYGGCGASSDAVLTLKQAVEDLRAACFYLSEAGYDRLVIISAGFGARVAFATEHPDIRTMVHFGPITGPLTYRWEEVFSRSQLDQLAHDKVMQVPDDSASPRQFFSLSHQTLQDYALFNPQQALPQLRCPQLLLHGQVDDQMNGLINLSQQALPLLPSGSRLEVIRGASNKLVDSLDAVWQVLEPWLRNYLSR